MASAPKLPASEDTESGKSPHYGVPVSPSTSSTKTSTPKPSEPHGFDVLAKAVGPGAVLGLKSVTQSNPSGKGRKHRTRKHKKHARKTKKHLRRK